MFGLSKQNLKKCEAHTLLKKKTKKIPRYMFASKALHKVKIYLMFQIDQKSI